MHEDMRRTGSDVRQERWWHEFIELERLVGGLVSGEGKLVLVKVDMPRGENTTGGAVKVAVAFVFWRVAEEDTRSRTRRKHVLGGGRHVREAETATDAHVGVVRRRAVEELERCEVLTGTVGSSVEEESGGGEGLGPERGRHGCVGEEGAHCFVQCAEHAFGAAILRGGIRA